MVHFNIKMQNPELVDLKFVTYAQAIHLSLDLLRHLFSTSTYERTLEISSQLGTVHKHL